MNYCKNNIKKKKELTRKALITLLNSEDSELTKSAVYKFYNLYAELTDLKIPEILNESLIATLKGMVVTPVTAANFLLDDVRTAAFLRGIHQALQAQLKRKNNIRILYAGCGPYASLITPLLQLYQPEQIRITLLDIHLTNVYAVQKLYDKLQLNPFIEQLIHGDATLPEIQLNGSHDIIISTAIQVGLNNTCQVPITRNLLRFLNKNGAFIPQQIKLDIYLSDQPIPFNDYEKEISIGTAFDFDTKKLPEVGKEIILQVPEGYEQYLKLYTHIRIHENIWLKNPKSTITFPLFISALRKKEPCKIAFSYQEHAIPRLDFQYLQEI